MAITSTLQICCAKHCNKLQFTMHPHPHNNLWREVGSGAQVKPTKIQIDLKSTQTKKKKKL